MPQRPEECGGAHFGRDTPAAYVIGGRVYSRETEYQKFMLDISKLAGQKQLDAEFVAKTCSMLKTAEQNKIDAHEQLCTYIAQSISRSLTHGTQAGQMQSIEKDMLEKKIIDLEAKNNSLMVNPHFLFNTLNCIARIAYFEHAPKTEELIYYLSDLLRYNVQNGDSLHTIRAELDNIEKYLYIQKARFQSRLQYTINVPEHIRSCRIPNMVLQPVVENALIHGISPKRDGGKIDIYAENHGDKITIFVVDNGNGFPRTCSSACGKRTAAAGNWACGSQISGSNSITVMNTAWRWSSPTTAAARCPSRFPRA